MRARASWPVGQVTIGTANEKLTANKDVEQRIIMISSPHERSARCAPSQAMSVVRTHARAPARKHAQACTRARMNALCSTHKSRTHPRAFAHETRNLASTRAPKRPSSQVLQIT
eukprot:2214873-Pleurochrysis_carterae.AAC.1